MKRACLALSLGLMVAATLFGCDNSSNGSDTGELCAQSTEAAHYIAAKSVDVNDVVRVTDEVIADRKYPALDDKVLGSIGAVVALKYGQETPDEISEDVRNTCQKSVNQ